MKHKKLFIIIFCGILFVPVHLISQETAMLSELETKAASSAEILIEKLNLDWGRQEQQYISIASFNYKGFQVPLGQIWARLLQDTLIEKGAPRLRVLAPDGSSQRAPEFRISGEILDVGNTITIHTDIVVLEDMSIAVSNRVDFPKSPELARLLIDESMIADGSIVLPDPFEPDTSEMPVPIEISVDGISRSLSSGDEDWFLIDIGTNDTVYIYTTGDIDTYMSVYDSDGNIIMENDDVGDDTNSAVTINSTSEASYIIMINGYDGATGSYTVYAKEAVPISDNYEPNDTTNSAIEIQLDGQKVETACTSDSDVDWFYFSLDTTQETFVSVYTTGGLDTQATLYDSDMNQIVYNDDGDEGYNARLGAFLKSGTYYVEISEINGASGEYMLFAETKNIQMDQWEPDNSILKPRNISVGDRQTHTFIPADDHDWVRFSLSNKREITLYTTGNVDTYLALYNSDGELIIEDDDSGDDYNALITMELDEGTYFAEVSNVDQSLTEEEYVLILK